MAEKKILVVEDSPTQLKMTVAALQNQRYSILTAMDGEEALRKVFADKPDLVVLDVVMPKMDGFQVCRKLKSSSETQHIPVIILTNKNQKVDEFWGKKQGADIYLTKPLNEEELRAAVAKSLA
ncbi:MAG: response regulator [Desulfobacterales bacterium]|nr:response regulator [Desulfobacterales bacterium]